MPGAIPDNYQPPPQHFSQQTHLIGPYQGPHQHFGNQTLPQQSTQMPVLGYEGHNCGSQPCIHGTGHHYQSQTQQQTFPHLQRSVQMEPQIGHLANPSVASFPNGTRNRQLQLQDGYVHQNDNTTGSYQPLQVPGTTVSDSFSLQDRQIFVPDGSDKDSCEAYLPGNSVDRKLSFDAVIPEQSADPGEVKCKMKAASQEIVVSKEECETLSSQEHQGHGNISSNFPYLDVRKLNEQEKLALYCRLTRDVKAIEEEYSNLTHATIVSIKARQVSVMELSTRLNTLGSLTSTRCPMPLLLNQLDEINQAENIEKLFHILRDYHSFFNYGVIERVISWFGTEDDKKRLEAYREHFERFCKRRTFECPSDIFGHCVDKGKSNLVVKVQGAMDPNNWYSLENVVNLRITLGDILKVEPETFYLYRIDNGCVELMFQVPSFIEEDIFPLSVEQKRSLASIGVSKLTCGSYRYLQVCMKITLNFVGASSHNSPLLSATSTTTIFPS